MLFFIYLHFSVLDTVSEGQVHDACVFSASKQKQTAANSQSQASTPQQSHVSKQNSDVTMRIIKVTLQVAFPIVSVSFLNQFWFLNKSYFWQYFNNIVFIFIIIFFYLMDKKLVQRVFFNCFNCKFEYMEIFLSLFMIFLNILLSYVRMFKVFAIM